ncbi:MAG: AI-2E family transporter [Chloroflexi bacterium]|nr:AI-2E family transporter [Chloroflexota bacterium]
MVGRVIGEEPSTNGEASATIVHRLPPGEVLRATLVIIAVLLGTYFLWRIQEVLFLLFVAILLAGAVEPLVNRLRRGPFSRGAGVLVVYSAILIALAIPIYLIIPNAVAQAAAFTESLPDRLVALQPEVGSLQPRFVGEAASSLLDQLIARVQTPAAPPQEQIVEAGTTLGHTLIDVVSVFVLSFYWLVERAAIKRVLLRAVPARRARDVNTVWLEVEEKLGGWMRGEAVLMATIGFAAGIGYLVIGLPNAALLGVIAGLMEVVPLVGPFLAFTPAVLVALALDPPRAIAVVLYALLIQQIESNVLVPRVMGHTVGVSPLTVLLGILIGSTLAGLPGAFVAVPLAAAIPVIVAHVFQSEDASQVEAHPPPERAEQTGYAPDAIVHR